MKTVFTFIRALSCLVAGILASSALAESLESPSLIELVEATRPAEGLEEEVRVRLRITLDVEGAVTEAEVVEGAGEAFDAAAREALLRSRFTPARRDGVAIPARFLFDYVFPAPTREVEEATPEIPEPTEPSPSEGDLIEEDLIEEDLGEELPDEALQFGARGEVRAVEEERRRSVEALEVVDMRDAQTRTADLGEVLARTESATVRREGGLGSAARIALAGLEGRQIRTFLDGIPLRLMGFGMGIANVPLGFVERLEIYRGVVPIRYGADAVGGAIDLISERGLEGHRVLASYQTGSFGTHRLALGGRVRDARTGLFARADAYFDDAKNDYEVDVRVADRSGRTEERRLRLGNAAYRGYGASLEAGISGRRRAKLASLRAFITDHDRALPHNVAMTVPYGEVGYGQADRGLLLRYENDFRDEKLSVALAGGFVAHRVRFEDLGGCAYDWFQQCALVRPVPGEMSPGGRNLRTVERTLFLRGSVTARPRTGHALTLSLNSELDRRDTERDTVAATTLTGRGTRAMIVGGAEYELSLGERFQNSSFVKAYMQSVTADDHILGEVVTLEVSRSAFGVGDSLRFDLSEHVYLKASYEWATRLPGSDEYFGDGVITVYNHSLLPERSHNVNLSIDGRLERDRAGIFRGQAMVFARRVNDLIWRRATDDSFQHQNVGEARSLGASAQGSYRSPGDWVDLRGSFSYLDFRNISGDGAFADVYGDRIPNRPFLEASGEVGVGVREVAREGDRLSALWGFRYVHGYFLAYESRGSSGNKLTIPSQFVMHAALRYVVARVPRVVSAVIEAQNLANVAVYDFYGIQRPRRAVYAKLTVGL